jgi:AcrR family transcriptional regulator
VIVINTISASSRLSSDRRSRRRADIRERLFRSSVQLFAEKGFAETTVEDITNAADVGKGTFFNYFPSKDHILLAFGEMQLAKLQAAVDDARRSKTPMREFYRSLSRLMTVEPTRNPTILRAILQAFLASSHTRESMLDLQTRVLALHCEMIQLGQRRGEIRNDLPALQIAQVFRQTIFGTSLLWTLDGEGTLESRIDSAFELVWKGLQPRNDSSLPLVVPMFW